MCQACAPRQSQVNDPELPGYDPNFPVIRERVFLPEKYMGKNAVFRTNQYAIFCPSSHWLDVDKYLADNKILARAGNRQAKLVLEQDRRHSVEGVQQDGLCALNTGLFLAKDATCTFGEGEFLFYFTDGSSARDRGVRVNMSGNPKNMQGPRRSYQDAPLVVSRKQKYNGKEFVIVVFLFDCAHKGKKVAYAERLSCNSSAS